MRAPFETRRCGFVRFLAIASALAFCTSTTFAQRAEHRDGTRPEGGFGEARAAPAPAPSHRATAPAPHALAPTGRPGYVDRSSHGSVRHEETHIVPRFDTGRRPEERAGEINHHDIIVRHDYDAGLYRHHDYDDFVFHRFVPTLPLGFLTFQIGGAPYYYSNGIYYQPMGGGYQEVYPPVGAAVPEPPNGSIPIEAGGQTYFYAGGAFYLQQPDGTYQIAPTPMGVIVPELPPGAVQVLLNDGSVAYQFNGVYYRPVFVNGLTQYQTFVPQ